MMSKRALAWLFVAQMIAAVAMAQGVTSEFGRVSGGEVALLTKQTGNLSGSLGFTMSKSKGYEATLGGTILQDRLWFFASAQQHDARLTSGVAQMQLPERAVSRALDAKLTGQLGDRHSFGAFFEAARQPYATIPNTLGGVTPSSFLSLRYTGVVSSNMFFNASFSQRSVTQPAWSFAPAAPSQGW
ncbi:MAG: hypothetical protein AABO58_04785 [Acidobacteriota bacterium]